MGPKSGGLGHNVGRQGESLILRSLWDIYGCGTVKAALRTLFDLEKRGKRNPTPVQCGFWTFQVVLRAQKQGPNKLERSDKGKIFL